MLGIIGLLASIIFLIVFAYKGMNALPLALISTLIVIVTNGMSVWDSLTIYMGGYAGFLQSYFLIFVAAGLYAKLMDITGSAIAIGYKFIDWFGTKMAIPVVIIITCVLSYGGVNAFVIIFAMAPIVYTLFKSADYARRLIPGVIGVGACTLTMTSLPGTPTIQNIIPTEYLGTTMTAAPVLSIIASALLLVLGTVYMQYKGKKCKLAGEHFSFPAGTDQSMYNLERENLPKAWAAFLPMIVIIVMIIGLQNIITNSSALTVLSMVIASGILVALNFKKVIEAGTFKVLNEGLGSAITAIASPCAIVGFGTLVKATPAFEHIVNAVLNMQLNPYFTAIFGTAIISGITGSASGGLTLTLQALSETLLSAGVNPDILHRLMSLASGSLDSLPHSSALFLMMSYNGLTHKEAYGSVFVTTVLIPAIVCIACTVFVVLLGM